LRKWESLFEAQNLTFQEMGQFTGFAEHFGGFLVLFPSRGGLAARRAPRRSPPAQVCACWKSAKVPKFSAPAARWSPQRGPPTSAPQARKMLVLMHFPACAHLLGWLLRGARLETDADCGPNSLGLEFQCLESTRSAIASVPQLIWQTSFPSIRIKSNANNAFHFVAALSHRDHISSQGSTSLLDFMSALVSFFWKCFHILGRVPYSL